MLTTTIRIRLATVFVVATCSQLALSAQLPISPWQPPLPVSGATDCESCQPPQPPDVGPQPTTPPETRPSFVTLMNRYTSFDLNGDGVMEINSLSTLFANQAPYSPAPKGVVIVLIDPQIVTDDPLITLSRLEMLIKLDVLGSDMSSDGFFPYFVEASVYRGVQHQDGRTVLALRRFLQDVHRHYQLAGVLLIGSFPDAALVRSVLVKPTAKEPKAFGSGSVPFTQAGPYLAIGSELITPHGEIVLGDMDGNWEPLYRQAQFTLTSYDALPLEPAHTYPVAGQTIETPHYQAADRQYQDVFLIQDHQVSVSASGGLLRLDIPTLFEPSREGTINDQRQPNRIARPEILVSRIDPRRVAVVPTARVDLDGKRPLDAAGQPQRLRYSTPTEVEWRRDSSLERRLIANYIDRSHAFRRGDDNDLPFRTSAVRSTDTSLTSPSAFNALLRKAAGFSAESFEADQATLVDYINWLKQPAVLRGIAAHSSWYTSVFGPSPASGLESVTRARNPGGVPRIWRWTSRQAGTQWVLEPSFDGLAEDASFPIYRTLWENQALAAAGQAFYVHDGCSVMFPYHAATLPYNDLGYGQVDAFGTVSNGESLLFYANGLGLMGRNKVFYDSPQGFYEAVKSNGHFGYGWRGYFRTDAADAELNERTVNPAVRADDHFTVTLARKRSYMWNIIGDFTLKLRY